MPALTVELFDHPLVTVDELPVVIEYVEWLRRFEDYVPDKKPSDVDAKTRAIADLCLLLFNSNEFMYIY